MKKFILVSTALLLTILGVSSSQKIYAGCCGNSNGKWGSWIDTSSCVASTCGTTQGTKTQKRTCENNPGSNQCNPGRSYCPSGYTESSITCPGRCRRDNNPAHCVDKIVEPADEQTQTVSCNDAPVIACASPSPSPCPSASPSPSVNPSPSVSPSPAVSPSPEPSPAPESSPEPGEQIVLELGIDGPKCFEGHFHVAAHPKKNGVLQTGVKVEFHYNGNTKYATTASPAEVDFDFQGNGTVTAKADGYPDASVGVEAPKDCSAGSETPEVLGASTVSGGGQVLGAMADTGNGLADIMNLVFGMGAGLIGLGINAYTKKNR